MTKEFLNYVMRFVTSSKRWRCGGCRTEDMKQALWERQYQECMGVVLKNPEEVVLFFKCFHRLSCLLSLIHTLQHLNTGVYMYMYLLNYFPFKMWHFQGVVKSQTQRYPAVEHEVLGNGHRSTSVFLWWRTFHCTVIQTTTVSEHMCMVPDLSKDSSTIASLLCKWLDLFLDQFQGSSNWIAYVPTNTYSLAMLARSLITGRLFWTIELYCARTHMVHAWLV